MVEPLRPYAHQLAGEFDRIPAERAVTLKQAAGFVRELLQQGRLVVYLRISSAE